MPRTPIGQLLLAIQWSEDGSDYNVDFGVYLKLIVRPIIKGGNICGPAPSRGVEVETTATEV
jgi:hypothetical protein